MPHYTGKNGAIRLYDSTATPFYLEILFEAMDLNAPIGRARPDQNLALDRGNLTTNAFYYSGPDDPILEPLDLSFSAMIDESVNRVDIKDALECGTVGGNAWATTKGDTSLTAGDGSSVATPAFEDTVMKTVNVESLWTGTTTDYGFQWNEVYFPPEEQTIAESEDVLQLSINGQIYGSIAEISAFTAGTDSAT